MRVADDWRDYEVIGTGGGEKLERWGEVYLLRPDPQIIWKASSELSKHKKLSAIYRRSSSGGGEWKVLTKLPEEWVISYKELKFLVKPMGFKHVGLFPEQAVNWNIMDGLIKGAKGEKTILNLFAYTGGASLACAKAGARVTHIDAAKGMVERAKQNAQLSGVKDKIRFIVDDCLKFVEREIKRGNKYDGIIMDPPSYGRGPDGEMWKIENDLFNLVLTSAKLLNDSPLFFLINSYTTGLQPLTIRNILSVALKDRGGNLAAYELALPTREREVYLPCGCSGLWTSEVWNKGGKGGKN